MTGEKDVVVSDENASVTLMKTYFVSISTDLELNRDSENFL